MSVLPRPFAYFWAMPKVRTWFFVERTCDCHLEGIREISLNSIGGFGEISPVGRNDKVGGAVRMGHFQRPRKFTIVSTAYIGTFPCILPQAVLA